MRIYNFNFTAYKFNVRSNFYFSKSFSGSCFNPTLLYLPNYLGTPVIFKNLRPVRIGNVNLKVTVETFARLVLHPTSSATYLALPAPSFTQTHKLIICRHYDWSLRH